jgi:hypothetical protein
LISNGTETNLAAGKSLTSAGGWLLFSLSQFCVELKWIGGESLRWLFLLGWGRIATNFAIQKQLDGLAVISFI